MSYHLPAVKSPDFVNVVRIHAARACKLFTLFAILTASLALSSCKSRQVQGDSRRSHPEVTVHVGNASRQQKQIVDEACSWLGTPYQYAGAVKGEGTDCSGMVMKVYEDVAGCKIPRNSAKQAEFCEKIEADEVAVGDLVFFATGKDADRVSHVGIVIDDSRFIHASASKGVVISDYNTPYYQRTFKMFGRVPLLVSEN